MEIYKQPEEIFDDSKKNYWSKLIHKRITDPDTKYALLRDFTHEDEPLPIPDSDYSHSIVAGGLEVTS